MKKSNNGRKFGLIAIISGAALISGYYIFKAIVPAKKSNKSGGSKPSTATGASSGGTFAPAPSSNAFSPAPSSGGSTNNSSSSASSSGFPLKNGSRGLLVQKLQWALQGLGKTIVADSIFGPQTQAALQSVTGKTTVDSQSELDSIVSMQYPTAPAPVTVCCVLNNNQYICTNTN